MWSACSITTRPNAKLLDERPASCAGPNHPTIMIGETTSKQPADPGRMQAIVRRCGDVWIGKIGNCSAIGATMADAFQGVMECRESTLRSALEVADECLALIEDVGHGAQMDNVTVARKIVADALQLFPPNAIGEARADSASQPHDQAL